MSVHVVPDGHPERRAAADDSDSGESWFRSTWCIDRHQWLRLCIVLAVATGVFTSFGLLVTEVFAPNPITRFDQDLAERLASGRTPFQDDLAYWGSFIVSTEVKIVATALMATSPSSCGGVGTRRSSWR